MKVELQYPSSSVAQTNAPPRAHSPWETETRAKCPLQTANNSKSAKGLHSPLLSIFIF